MSENSYTAEERIQIAQIKKEIAEAQAMEAEAKSAIADIEIEIEKIKGIKKSDYEALEKEKKRREKVNKETRNAAKSERRIQIFWSFVVWMAIFMVLFIGFFGPN